MNKSLSCLLAAAVMLLAFTGCQQGNNDPASGDAGKATAGTGATAAAGEGTVEQGATGTGTGVHGSTGTGATQKPGAKTSAKSGARATSKKTNKNPNSTPKTKGNSNGLQAFKIARTAYHEDLDALKGDGEYGEAVRNLFAEIEGEYQIKIEVDYYQPTEFMGIAQAAITSGDTGFADLMDMNLFSFGPMYGQGLLMNTKELPGLKVSSNVWSKAIVDLATFKSGNYGVGNAGFTGTTGKAMYYNKTLLNSLKLEDPLKLVRAGKWTWDKLRELAMKAVKDQNNDGKFTEADRYGCTSMSYDGLVPAFLTSGIQTIVKDKTGRLVYNLMGNDAAAKALQKFHNTFTTADGMFYAAGLNATVQQHQFLTGKSLFLLGRWTPDEDPSEDIEIGTLPLPKYTESGSYRAPGFHNDHIITVPRTAERKELIGKVLQLIGEKTKDFGTLIYRDDSINFVDRDTYMEMTTKYIAPNYTSDLMNIMITANESIAIGTMRAIGAPVYSGKPSSQYIQGQATTIQSLLDDMFNQK